MNLKPIQDQVVVILGASSGIGRETTLQFARRGAKVVVAARSVTGLESLAGEITQDGGQVTWVDCDVTEFEQVERVAQTAVDVYGRIDTWVSVAGVGGFATFEDTSLEDIRRIIDVNLMGQVHGAKAALPRLRQAGGGALISISSVEGLVSLPLHSPYAASKHAVEGLFDGIRRELMYQGVPISVTSVKPATINTPFFTNAMNKMDRTPKGAPPVYQPSVVAECVLYAAEHPVRDLYAGGAAKKMVMNQITMPGLLDRMLAKTAIPAQKTDDTASGDITGNLYEPSNDTRIEGDLSDMASAFSPYTWLETHPQARALAFAGAALGLGLLLSSRDD
jgi:short-subunit dehydrogenase